MASMLTGVSKKTTIKLTKRHNKREVWLLMFGPYVQLGCKILPVSPSLLFAPWVMIMMGSNNIQQHAWPHSLSTASCTWVENIQLAKKKGGILPDHLDKTNLVTTLDQLAI